VIQHKRTDRIYELSIKYMVAGSMTRPYDLREMTRAHRACTQKNERRGLHRRVKILNGVLKASRRLKKLGIILALKLLFCRGAVSRARNGPVFLRNAPEKKTVWRIFDAFAGRILFLRSQVAGKPAAFAASIMDFKRMKIHAGRDKA